MAAAHDCRDVIDLLTEYMEGSLPPGKASALEAELKVCEPCAGFLDSLRKTRAAVARLHCDDLPEACHRQLRSFLDRRMSHA